MPKRGNQEFDAANYVTASLFEDEIMEIKEAFDMFDADLSGAISVQELVSSFKTLGFDEKHEGVFAMLKDIDTNGDGELDFPEFLSLLTAKMSSETPKEEIEKVFKCFDKDRTGTISAENLKEIAKGLGDDLSLEVCENVIRQSDLDGDGSLTLEDFVSVMHAKE